MDQVVHEAQLSGLMHMNKEQYHLMGGGNLFPPAEKSSGSAAAGSSPEKQAVEDYNQRSKLLKITIVDQEGLAVHQGSRRDLVSDEGVLRTKPQG